MTAAVDNVQLLAEQLTRQEAQILAHYASGESTPQIASAVNVTAQFVTETVDGVVKGNRGLARNVALAWQRLPGNRQNAATPARTVQELSPRVVTPVAPRPRPGQLPEALRSRPAPDPAPAPAAEPGPAPVDVPVAVRNSPPRRSAEVILKAAEESGVPALVRIAGRARTLVDQLREELDKVERERELREELARLERRCADLRTQLRGGGNAATPSRPPGSSPAPAGGRHAEIRKWAADNGVQCSDRGRIPASVVEAYEAAHR